MNLIQRLMTTLTNAGAKLALESLTSDKFVSKLDACQRLAQAINSGLLSESAVMAAASCAAPAPAPAADLSGELGSIRAQVRSLSDEIREVASKAATPANVVLDHSLIQREVSAAIAEAFAPFKQAVEAAGAESVVASMSVETRSDTAKSVFGVGGDASVTLYDDPLAPPVDPCFIWQPGLLMHLLQSQETGENLWLGGEKGTGKTQLAQQFAARTGRQFFRVNFHKTSASEEFVGAVGLVNGATEFVPGPVLRAFTTPGAVLLLDELSNCHEGELAQLNGLLEPNARCSIGGRIWTRAPGVLIIAADNTLGSGDASGRYVGTRQMNAALLDRFARSVPVSFLPERVEIEALMRHTGCVERLAVLVVGVLTVCREGLTRGDLVDAPSIRQAVAFIRALRWHSLDDAWSTTIAAKQPPEGAVALQAIFGAYVTPEFKQLGA